MLLLKITLIKGIKREKAIVFSGGILKSEKRANKVASLVPKPKIEIGNNPTNRLKATEITK